MEDRRPRLSGQAERLFSIGIIGKTESCRQWFFTAFMLAALSMSAQSVALTPRGVVVAHDGVIDVYDPRSLQRLSRTDGVEYAGEIIADENCALRTANCNLAILDPLHNQARVNDKIIATGETPIAGAYVNHQLFILERDARTLSRGDESVKSGAHPDFLRVAAGKLYVYSAVDGLLQEITTSPFVVARELHAAPFASDIETDGKVVYLTYPRDGSVRVIDLGKMTEVGKVRVGSMTTDLAFAGNPTALTARRLAVADPAARRVWLIEGEQSTRQAFARGFLRGILGLGLFSGRHSEFPTGVDRVIAHGSQWIAFDSSSGTLYSVTKTKSNVLARGLTPHAFALGDGAVYVWQNGTLVAQKTGG